MRPARRQGQAADGPGSSGFTRPVCLALWQGALRRPESWAAELREVARSAKAQGAELLLTPELCLPGFHFFGSQGFAAEPEAVESELCGIARELGLALCVGYAERRRPHRCASAGSASGGSGGVDDEGAAARDFWNTAVLVDGKGELRLRYRKHHLWGNEGNLGLTASEEDLQVVDLAFEGPAGPCTIRTSLLICYDVEYPEMVRILACEPHRAELVLVPTALPYTEPNAATKIVPARAMENRIFIAYCNYPCVQRVDGEYFCGNSCIAGPDAEFVAGPFGWEEEKLLLGNIGWTEHLRWLAEETPYLRDRRPDFYRSQGHCQEKS